MINGLRTPNTQLSINEGPLLKKLTGKSEGVKVNASLPGYSKWEMVKSGKTERIYEQ